MKKFWKHKKILITGHSGFMGGWLTLALSRYTKKIYGLSLRPKTKPNFYKILSVNKFLKKEYFIDLRKSNSIKIIKKINPDFIFHLAAQPIVHTSYLNPLETYETNIIGTINILEAARNTKKKQSIIIVTSDKVYHNDESSRRFKENDKLAGKDPYSSSKSCQDIVTQSYNFSYFENKMNKSIGIARIGNVIGGGDWSPNRLFPDIFKKLDRNSKIIIRNPKSVRPWQHVVEPTYFLLMLAKKIYSNKNLSGSYNLGPNSLNQCSVKKIVNLLDRKLKKFSINLKISNLKKNIVKEAKILKLDNYKMKKKLKIYPKYNINKTLDLIVEWYLNYKKKNIKEITLKQISRYFSN